MHPDIATVPEGKIALLANHCPRPSPVTAPCPIPGEAMLMDKLTVFSAH